MSVSPLCKALALYSLLDELEAPERGIPLREIERLWPGTGLRLEDLHEVLNHFGESGDFELVVDRGVTRVRTAAFELQRLNPGTLNEIEEISLAYEVLESMQQRPPAGPSYGRRGRDASI